MSDIKIGDYVSAPKGTPIYSAGFVLSERFCQPSKRATKGRVTQITRPHSLEDLIPEEEHVVLRELAGHDLWKTWGESYRLFDGQWSAIKKRFPEAAAAEQRVIDRFGGDLRFVVWGSSVAHIGAVTKIDPPVAKEAKVSKLKEMVKGSRWRFTRPVTITAWVYPERDHRLVAEADAWRAAGKPYNYDNPYEHAHEMPIFTVPAGLEFTVSSDKKTSADRQKDSGRAIRVDLDESQIEYHIKHTRPDGSSGGRGVPSWEYWGENPWWQNGFTLSYRQIEDAVEAISIPESIVYVLRDGEDGKYFAGFDYDYTDRKDHVRMVDTFKSAKKYANEGNARSSILSWTGFFEDKGIEGVSTARKMDLPDSWVLVPVDQVTLKQGEPREGWREELFLTRIKK
jgi:hypothetical protein